MVECFTTKTCKCGNCDCNLADAHDTERNMIRVHDFLFGLDDATHGEVRSQICAQSPLPDLDIVYQVIVQNETVQVNAHKEPPAVVSFAAQSSPQPTTTSNNRQPNSNSDYQRPRYTNPDANVTCTSCGRLGHRATGCFRVIGYPEWWGTRPRTQNNYQSQQGNTQTTGQNNTPARANSSQIVGSSTEIGANLTLTDSDRQGLTGFSDSQWQTLVKLMAPKSQTDTSLSGKNDEALWILDTGATHHMTGRLDLLQNLQPVPPVSVKLLAGANVLSNQQGTVPLTSHNPSSRVVGLLPGVHLKSSSVSLCLSKCDVCLRSKQTRTSFPDSYNKASGVFELIHCDLWGPYRTAAICRSKYFLTIVDDYSRAVWLYLLPNKTEVSARLREFLALVKRQFNCDVKTLRSDNGTEFMCLTKFFREQGIIHETSCVGTPQQNGRVERKHRHILNVARALRFQSGLPIEFWAECALTACFLINRTPSKLLSDKTPFEMLFSRPPVLDQLRVFGCLCYAHNLDHHGDKFASRSRRCVFLGYPYGKKGWRLYDLDNETVFSSRDVVFHEDEFPFQKPSTEPTPAELTLSATQLIDELESTPTIHTDTNLEPITHTTDTEPHTSTEEDDPVITNTETNDRLGRGFRNKKPSSRLTDFIVDTIKPVSNNTVSINTVMITSLTTSTSAPSTTSGMDHPLSNYHTYDRFSHSHRSYLVAPSVATEPRSYKEAMQDKAWKDAMRAEIDALELNQTWDIQELPPGKIALGCKWVFRVKLKADGTLERYKARLVFLGNNQIKGIDYGETFAPVAKMTTVRIFLDLAAKQDYEVHQMDVHNAFLHGDLEEEVYIKLPPGFRSDTDNRVCRLRKSLYGLKQAPRCWFSKLAMALRVFGFVQSKSDYSLFIYTKSGTTLRVLVYVDDLIIAGNSSTSIADFKVYMSTCFHMKDLGSSKKIFRNRSCSKCRWILPLSTKVLS